MASTTTSTTSIIPLVIAGTELPMRQAQAKKTGNTYFTVYQQGSEPGGFGTPIPALDTELPDVVTVNGQDVELTEQLETSFIDRKTKQRVTKTFDPGTRMVARDVPVVVDGEDRVFKITLSLTQTPGVWNLTTSIHRKGGGGGGNQRKAVSLAAL